MLLNDSIVQVSVLKNTQSIKDIKDLIKTDTVEEENNTFTLPYSSKQLSISPPITSMDSKFIR